MSDLLRIAVAGQMDPRRYSMAARRVSGLRAVRITSDLTSALGDDVDAVVICPPVRQRVAWILRSAVARKHVLVEAPISWQLEEAQSAVAHCQEAGICLMVAHSMRFSPYFSTIRAELSSGRLGRPGLARLHHWQPMARGTPSEQRADLIAGDVLEELDGLLSLFGQLPTELLATPIAAALPGRGWLVHCSFSDGAMALLDVTKADRPGCGPFVSLHMIGSQGACYADDHHNMNLLRRATTEGVLVPQGDEHIWRQLEAFATAIGTGRTPPSSGRESLAALQVATAAAESIVSRGVVSLVRGNGSNEGSDD